MNLKYIKVKNFLSIGEEPVEIDFTKLGSVIQVVGRNLDRGEDASNSSGKSSALMSILYGLYGKTLKDLSQKEVINDISEKGLEIDIRWDNCRVLRTRKPDGLRFWKDGNELTLGGIPATQEEIEKELGLPYQSFVNITYFGQHNEMKFLTCDPATKRQVIENILALDQYNQYCKSAKERKRKLETEITVNNKQYSILSSTLESYKNQHNLLLNQADQWVKNKEIEITTLENKLRIIEKEIGSIDEAQKIVDNLIKELNSLKDYQIKIDLLVVKLKNEKNKLLDLLSDCVIKTSKIQNDKNLLDYKILKINEELNRIDKLLPGNCPICFSSIDPENSNKVASHLKHHLSILQDELSKVTDTFNEAEHELKNYKEKEKENNVVYKTALEKKIWTEKTILEYLENIRKEEAKLVKLKGGEAGVLTRLIEEKQTELLVGHPFHDAICQSETQLTEVIKKVAESRNLLKATEAKIPYVDFWIKAFGDQGIRKLVIQDILPTLNAKINYWLMFLADGKIKLSFDTELQETITYGPPTNKVCRYKGLSGGELCRVDLAISQGFAQITALNSKICPMFTCLDEVAANVDRPGVACLYNTILELAKERKVFVVSHDPDLQSFLACHDTLIFERKNGVTRLVKN